MSGPVPLTPLEEPRARSARAKLTAGTFAGWGTSVGVGAGVLVLTTWFGVGMLVSSAGGVVELTQAAASSVAVIAVAYRRADCLSSSSRRPRLRDSPRAQG